MFLRRVFHCGRSEDPFDLADADSFGFEENGRLDPDTFVGIWIALNLLMTQVRTTEKKFKVNKMRDLIENYPTKSCFHRICPDLFLFLDESNIEEFPHWESLRYHG